MIDRTPTRPIVPDFTPVPRKHRHDGWTAERQRAFIDALAETGSVKHACARINMSAEGAYYLRRRPDAESFRRAWEAALNHGVQRLADIAIDRAIEGVVIPIYHRGEQVGERRWHDNRLLMFILRHHMPARYGPLGALKPGTKHPDTIAREAEAAKEKEAWIEEYAGFLAQLVRQHRYKVRCAAEARLAGDEEGARMLDQQCRQLERAMEGDAKGWSIWAAILPILDGKAPTHAEEEAAELGEG